jgi:hypothetical protein
VEGIAPAAFARGARRRIHSILNLRSYKFDARKPLFHARESQSLP